MYDHSEGLKRLLLSQYFVSGIQAAGGVALVALVFFAGVGSTAASLAAVGALCVSIVDMPSPPHQKLYQLVAALILCTAVILLMGAASGHPWRVGGCVLLVSFVSAMVQSYGKQVLLLSFSLLLVVIISVGSPVVPAAEVVPRALLFGGGAAIYVAYALVAGRLLTFRTKRQALAESLFSLAQYIRVKSHFYDPGADIDRCYADLVRQQVTVIDRQQAAREFILRRVRSAQDRWLVATFLGALDVYERLFSSQTDYAVLQERFEGQDVLIFLRDLTEKGAQDLEGLAYSLLPYGRASRKVNYKAERYALEYELNRLSRAVGPGDHDVHALAVLRDVVTRVGQGVAQIREMHHLSRSVLTRAEILDGASLRPFLTAFSLSPAILVAELKLQSPNFRFAVRLTLAMGVGYSLAHILPYATHGYWILLTIAVILRSSYSVTKQRRNDRLVGTLFGAIFTAALLHFGPPDWVQLAVLFTALCLAHTFVMVKYRYASAAASVMALLQVHMLSGVTTFAITERLIDTLVGAALAFSFSYVLPNWERASLPRQLKTLLLANGRYARAVLDIGTKDMDYRLARKLFFDSIALVTGTLERMLSEPKGRHMGVRAINEFVTLNYIFAAHVAAVRILTQHEVDDLDHETLKAAMAATLEGVDVALIEAMSLLEGATATSPVAHEMGMADADVASEIQWTAAMLLTRRLGLIQLTAQKIRDSVGKLLA